MTNQSIFRRQCIKLCDPAISLSACIFWKGLNFIVAMSGLAYAFSDFVTEKIDSAFEEREERGVF